MTGPVLAFSGGGLQPLYDTAREDVVTLQGGTILAQGTLLGQVPGTGTGVNEVQRITITGAPTGGSFALFYGGLFIANVPFNATAAAVAALVNGYFGFTVVAGSGGPLPGAFVDLTFTGEAGSFSHALMTKIDALTGGAAPATAITRQTAGRPAGGYFAAYNDANTDGTQTAKRILRFPAATTVMGWVIPGDNLSMGHLVTPSRGAPAFFQGHFRVGDLVGLDAAAVADLGKLISGNAIGDANAILAVTGAG